MDFRATGTFYIEISHASPLETGSLSVSFSMDGGAPQNITAYFNEINPTTFRSADLQQFTRALFNLPSNDRDRTMTVTTSAANATGAAGTTNSSFIVYPLAPPSY